MAKPIRIPLAYFKPAPAQKEIVAWNAEEAFRPPLEAAFATANGRADSFTICALAALLMVKDAEASMDKFGVPKKDRVGAELHIRSAGPEKNAYKYAAAGTEARFVRRNGSWELLWVKRVDVHPKQVAKRDLYMSDAAHRKIAETAMKGFRLKSAPAVEE